MKKAQSWSIDFILGMLIFLLAGALSIKIITNTSSDDEFRNIFDEAKFISQTLISEGYPSNWTNNSFVRVGLMSNGIFNDSKLLNLTRLSLPGAPQKGYYPSKKYLNTRYEYYFFLEDEYGRVLNASGLCGFGFDKVKHLPDPNKAAYYHTNSNLMQNSMVNTFNVQAADIYSNAQIDNLFNSISSYTFIFMENPQLDSFSALNEENIAEILQNWTSKGNTLILTEEVNMEGIFLNANFSSSVPAGIGDATVKTEAHFSMAPGLNITFTNKKTFIPKQTDDYLTIAEYSNGPAIATWRYGTGHVIYLSDLDSSPSLISNTETAISPFVYAFCGNVNVTSFQHKNLVKIVRILPRESSIVKLNLYTWPINS